MDHSPTRYAALPGGGSRLGLGLWNSIPGTTVTEIALLAIGVWLYVRTTRARDRIGRYAFAAYVGLLQVFYVSDRFSGPPPSVAAIAGTGVAASVMLIPWAWWFDRHRSPRASAPEPGAIAVSP